MVSCLQSLPQLRFGIGRIGTDRYVGHYQGVHVFVGDTGSDPLSAGTVDGGYCGSHFGHRMLAVPQAASDLLG
jgi:hypothetical protein